MKVMDELFLQTTILDKSKLGYVAGPYTAKGLTGIAKSKLEKYRYNKLTEVTAKLTEDYGCPLFSPITHSHHLAKVKGSNLHGAWELWEPIDTRFLASCDYILVVLLEGWNISTGVLAEIDMAQNRFHIPVVTYNPYTGEYAELHHFKGEQNAVRN